MITLFIYGWIVGTIAVPVCLIFGFDTVAKLVHLSNQLFMYFYNKTHGEAAARRLVRASPQNRIIGSLAMSFVDDSSPGGPVPCVEVDPHGVTAPRLAAVCQMAWYYDNDAAMEDVGVASVLSAASGHASSSTAVDCRIVLFDSVVALYHVVASHNTGGHEWLITHEELIGRIPLEKLLVRHAALNPRRGGGSGELHGSVLLLCLRDGEPLFGPAQPGGWESSPFNSTFHSVERRRRRGDSTTGASVQSESDPASNPRQRHLLALKFNYARELERWQSLLEGYQESFQWHAYMQTITTPNTFNIFLSRVFFQSTRTTALANFMRKKIQKKLDKLRLTKIPREIEGRILIDDVVLGHQVPIFSNVSSPTITAKGEMSFDLDLLYRGGCTLCFRFTLTYRGIRIPHVLLSITIVHVSGRLHVSIGPPPSKTFWVGVLTQPAVSLEVHQGLECGRGLLHRILASLPDLSSIATNLIKLYIYSDLALPRLDDFPLPSVAKTPPSSPTVRTPWNTPFDRRRAAAMHKKRARKDNVDFPETSTASPTCATPTGAFPSSGSPSTRAAVRRTPPQRLPTRASNARAGEVSPKVPSRSFDASGTGQARQSSVAEVPPSRIASSLLMGRSTATVAEMASEDVVRHRLRKTARSLMRQSVRRVDGFQGELDTPSMASC